ncbi:nitroreductase family protein [Lacrimispora saccharolytica]|uniref:Nitroreductase n=1 Tax=Lacrimispora saccharolytica (strain ATCC 35040 / DSM 2544 / NRCC 2533 / WM1) TaxID=610130 RepID=D9R332_LACSW|nr:nitroreductase family protein [Lacrimispora saccharolytica]ADL03022.1 nitroreductase [[Clostridium] saccharolyticum WM1]QRV18792.1 nitroreductase family protein [Lacrimispora saccharolytica]
MNQTIKELMERKSVRVYEERVIEPEKKAAILEAALQAPTAGNMTLYSIIDVTDQKRKETLSITCDNQPFIAKAPLVLVFVADYHRWYELFCHYEDVVRKPGLGDLMLACDDALIAAQNAVVAAESLGIGSCYIGDIMEQYETHRDLFGLPKYAVPAAMVVFGYPTKQQAERKKPERLRPEAVVFENSYRRLDPEEFTRELKRIQGREEDFEHWVKAFCKRKWNSDFSTEMSRSMEAMIESWKKEE